MKKLLLTLNKFTSFSLANILVVSLLAAIPASIINSSPAQAVTCSSSAGAQNNITVTPVHGKIFYIDTGQNQKVDASYIGYKVAVSATKANLWVRLDGFSGGALTLANSLDANYPLGDIANGGSKLSYFLLKASKSSALAQSHNLHVYQGRPDLAGSSELYGCTFTFLKVAETIKAAANKVNSISSSTTALVAGGNLTITVRGYTGTIGQGSPLDGTIIWLSPAARSTWPTQALRLTSTSFGLYVNKQYKSTVNNGDFTDVLYVKTLTNGGALAKSYYYQATYVFRVIGQSAVSTAISPVAQISSGTQIKHTDMGSLPTATVNTNNITVDARLGKTANSTVSFTSSKVIINYTITLSNFSTNGSIVVDQVIDAADPTLTINTGTVRLNTSTTLPDPIIDTNGNWIFSSPITVPAATLGGAAGTAVITYQMIAKSACVSGETNSYENSATGKIGNTVFASTATTATVVVSGVVCNNTTAIVTTNSTNLPVEATTQPATSINTTSATLNGTVDPNAQSGLTTIFELSTDPNLSSSVTNVSLTSNGTTTSAIDPYAISQSASGLSSNTTYYFRTKVGSGSSAVYGAILSFQTDVVPSSPAVVTTSASNVTTTTADINGTINSNYVSGGATGKFQWILDPGGNGSCIDANISAPTTVTLKNDDGTTLILYSASPTEVSTSLSGLTANNFYCYRVMATYSTTSNVYGSWVAFKAASMLSQTITYNVPTFPAGATTMSINSTQSSTATTTSNLTITYTSNTPDICTVDANGLITSAASGSGGVCSITASQPGNLSYYPATPVTITFQVVGTVILSYDLNGATGGSTPTSQTVPFNTSATVNNPSGTITKTNFAFAGWNTNSGGTGTDYSGGSSITLTSNTVLYAKWTATITYDGNSNSSGTVPDPQTSVAGLISLRSNSGTLARTSYTFVGWNTNNLGTGNHYDVGANYNLQGNVTLFAEWVPVGKYRVTYYGMGSNGGTVPAATDVDQNSSYTVSSSLPTKTGWTFDGWYTKSSYSGGTRYVGGNSFTVSANTSLYAMWKGAVTYNVNGATAGSNPATQNPYEGTSFTTAAGTGITKTYYTFSGWNTTSAGDGDNYLASTSYTLTTALDLYARWIPNNLTVTFDDNVGGGGQADYTQTVRADTDESLALNTFSRTSYVFMGWATTSANATAGTIALADGATVHLYTNTTYYAVWKSEVTVTYTAGSNGTILGDSPQVWAAGQTTTEVIATPNSGYYFTSWDVSSALTGQSANRTDTVPSISTTYTASFAAIRTPYLAWSNPTAITYGTALSSTQLNAIVKTTSTGTTLTATCDYTPSSGAVLAAGTRTLSVSCTPDDTSYSTITGSVSIVVNPKAITLTAVDKSKNYLAANPSFTFTIDASTALVGTDSITAVTYSYSKDTSDTYPAYSLSTTVPTEAGVYVNTPSLAVFGSGSASNYTLTYVAGTYTINKIAQASITFANQTYLALSTHTLVASGGSGTGGFSYAVTSGSCTVSSGDQLEVASSGPCTVRATKALDRNYLVQTADSTITVSLNSWTLTAGNKSYTQGGTVPTLTATASPSGALSGSPTCNVYASSDGTYSTPLTINASLATGNYVIRCTGTASAGYGSPTIVTGTLTVTNLLSWSITADSASYVTPGTPRPVASGSASPADGLSGSLTCGYYTQADTTFTSAFTLSDSTTAGSYVVHCTGTKATGYADPSINDGVLTVTQSTWTLTAADQSYLKGSSVPTLTAASSPSGGLSGSYTCSVYANSDNTYSSAVAINSSMATGTYVIHCTGAASVGYATGTLVNGTLTVTAPVSYSISIALVSNGSGSASPTSVGANGSTTLSASPNTGYHLVSWSCDGGSLSGSTLSDINANIVCTPTFAINTYTLTYTAGSGGSVTGTSPQTVNHGSDGTSVSATADPGYHFVNWSDASTNDPRTDTNVQANLTVTANFAADNTYTVTYSDNVSSETISVPTDSTNYSDGASVTVSATEPTRSGYTFNGWTTDSGNSGTLYKTGGANTSLTISSANITLYAKWTANTGSGGSGGGSTPAPVVAPASPRIIAISAAETCAVEGQLTLSGEHLSGATVTVDGLYAIVTSSSDSLLVLNLPTYYVGVRTLTVTNSAGSASTTVKYVLVDRPLYQNFVYPQMFKGQEFSYTFSALEAAKYSLSGVMPNGLTLNPLTGEISGTPGVDGTFFFTLVASNVCGVSYLHVYMFVDKEIPNAFTCSVLFNVPRSDNITPAKLTALKNCLGNASALSPSSIDPVIFISGGIPLGLTPEQSLAHPRYKQIVDLIKSMGIPAQIYVGAFSGSSDTVQLNVYWPEPTL